MSAWTLQDATNVVIALAVLAAGLNIHLLVRRTERQWRQIRYLTHRVWKLEGSPAWTPEREAEADQVWDRR